MGILTPSSSQTFPLSSSSTTDYNTPHHINSLPNEQHSQRLSSSPEFESEKLDDDHQEEPYEETLISDDSNSSSISVLEHSLTGENLLPLNDNHETIVKTLYLFTRNYRRKYLFTDVAFPTSDVENVLYYIFSGATRSPSKWESIVHRGPNPKVVGEGESKVVATIERGSWWRFFTVTFQNSDDNGDGVGVGVGKEVDKEGVDKNVKLTNVGLGKRGYEFEFNGKKYRWCGTTRYSKLGKLEKGIGCDVKLINSETKALIASFERKVIHSVKPQNDNEASSVTKTTELKDKRQFLGYLHFHKKNNDNNNMEKEVLDELIVITTAYCVIEAEHRKRSRNGP